MSTQEIFSYIGTESLCCFSQKQMIEFMGVRIMARKGGLANNLENQT